MLCYKIYRFAKKLFKTKLFNVKFPFVTFELIELHASAFVADVNAIKGF